MHFHAISRKRLSCLESLSRQFCSCLDLGLGLVNTKTATLLCKHSTRES